MVKEEDYKRLLHWWRRDNSTLIFLTSWLSDLRQVKVLRFLTKTPWFIVHDAMYHLPKPKYKSRFDRLDWDLHESQRSPTKEVVKK